MPHTTVRIAVETHELLRGLATREHSSLQAVVARALEDYRRRRFLEEVNAGFAAIRDDAAAWRELKHERALWDRTLDDGLSTSTGGRYARRKVGRMKGRKST